MCGAARPEGRMHSASSSHARALHPRPIVRRLPPSRQPIKCSVMESEQAPAKKSNNDASRRAAELVGGCDRLSARIANFQGRKPHVEGIIKLQRAVQREREVALGLHSSPDPARGVQGLENNLRGFSLELECADWAPDVTAVRKRFASRTPSIHAKLEDGEVVEVDVVAQGGLLWIECKAERGRVATGLVQQALALKEVANAPCNLRPFGIAPRVAAFVTGDMGDFEAQTLRDAGILILHAGGESGSAALDPGAVLPPPPSALTVANLDITALFALVSEVSAATTGSFAMFLDDPLVREWAAKKPQHASCLAAELEDPLNLEITLQSYDRLVAHPSVLRRFRKILDTMGGPREKKRWTDVWSSRVESYDAFEDVAAPAVEERRRRVRSLERISAPQLDAFELGEMAGARTFTANGRAVLSAAEQGVLLETHVHRAIWLVGL